MKRSEIMDGCPEEFENDLTDIVDSFENSVNEIKDALDSISSVSDLDRVGDALSLAKSLSEDLY